MEIQQVLFYSTAAIILIHIKVATLHSGPRDIVIISSIGLHIFWRWCTMSMATSMIMRWRDCEEMVHVDIWYECENVAGYSNFDTRYVGFSMYVRWKKVGRSWLISVDPIFVMSVITDRDVLLCCRVQENPTGPYILISLGQLFRGLFVGPLGPEFRWHS